ncbi:MAG: choice-of-anchor K domain-containing protein, partial [Verrucomicrobiae bacterium]|nr:choice-of-anchor K domain-containing protein [Verrucomicrobiae bacterium]
DITVSALQVSGDAGGAFFDPLGSAAMVTNLTESGVAESSYFDWGDVVRRKGDTAPNLKRSSLEFAGLGFGDILEGERFLVGNLDYYNGSPYAWDLPTLTMSTGADGVSFGIDISMVADGMNIDTRFSFDFELINVINVNDPLNPWQDADFVRISSPVAVERLQIEDRFYEFRIEFGESTIKGFAEFDEFYVLENASASVNVYGTFYELTGSSDDDD